MSALAFNNSKVQELRRLIGRRSSRHDDGAFVVEGPVLVAEAVAAGWHVESQFVPEGSDAWIGDRRRCGRDRSSSPTACSSGSHPTQTPAGADRHRANA